LLLCKNSAEPDGVVAGRQMSGFDDVNSGASNAHRAIMLNQRRLLMSIRRFRICACRYRTDFKMLINFIKKCN
jgi:hypothetical protein